jgi:hypothetical protein
VLIKEKEPTATGLMTEKLYVDGNYELFKEKADYAILYRQPVLIQRKRDKAKVAPVIIPLEVTVKKDRAHE